VVSCDRQKGKITGERIGREQGDKRRLFPILPARNLCAMWQKKGTQAMIAVWLSRLSVSNTRIFHPNLVKIQFF